MEKRPKASADGKLRSDPQGQIPCNGLDTGPVDEFPLDLIAMLMGTDLAVPPVATQIDGPIRTFAHGNLSFPDIGRRKNWALCPGFHASMRPFLFGLRLAIVCFFQCWGFRKFWHSSFRKFCQS